MYESEEMYEHREKFISKSNVIKITKENLHLLKEENIMFIEVSNEGINYIMDKKANIYNVSKDMLVEEIYNCFPEYKKATLDNQEVYTAINLGLDRELLIKTCIYDEFLEFLKMNIEYEYCYNTYCYWMENAEEFLDMNTVKTNLSIKDALKIASRELKNSYYRQGLKYGWIYGLLAFELEYKEIEYEGEEVYHIYVVGGLYGAMKDPNFKSEGTGFFSKIKYIDGEFNRESGIECIVYKKDGKYKYLSE